MLLARVGEHGPVVTLLALLVIGVVCLLRHFITGVLKSNRILKQLELRTERIEKGFNNDDLVANEIDVAMWHTWIFVTTAVIVHVGLIVSFKHDKLISTQSAINCYMGKIGKLIGSNSPNKRFLTETMQFVIRNCKDASIRDYSGRLKSLVQGFFPRASSMFLDKALHQVVEAAIAIVNGSGFSCTGNEPSALNPDMGY